MPDLSQAKFVELREREGQYVVVLLDADRQEVGHGFRGPNLRRAQQDLKYWKRDKGLEEVPT